MFNTPKTRRILNVVFCVLALAGVVAVMSFANGKIAGQRIQKLHITMLGTNNFIEKSEVEQLIQREFGTLRGRLLQQLNLQTLENGLSGNPYIKRARVNSDVDGTVSIAIEQRKPVMRIINNQGQDFYVDGDGKKMPVSNNLTANVVVASGNIQEAYAGRADTLNTAIGKELYKVASYLNTNKLWNAQVEQLHVNADEDIEMVPRVGDHLLILGNADSLDVKFANLLIFYKKAMPKVGWDTYKAINLKYLNQVVATRADGKEGVARQMFTARDSAAIANKATNDFIKQQIREAVKKDIVQSPAPAVAAVPQVKKVTTPAAKKAVVVKAKQASLKVATKPVAAVQMPTVKAQAQPHKTVPAKATVATPPGKKKTAQKAPVKAAVPKAVQPKKQIASKPATPKKAAVKK